MPRSDFPDLLQILINCSEYWSSCTEKRSKISLGTLLPHLWIGLPCVKTKTFLWVIDVLCVFSSNASQRHFHFTFLSAVFKGTQVQILLQLSSLCPGWVAGERTSWCHGWWERGVGWDRVVRQKAGNKSFP